MINNEMHLFMLSSDRIKIWAVGFDPENPSRSRSVKNILYEKANRDNDTMVNTFYVNKEESYFMFDGNIYDV